MSKYSRLALSTTCAGFGIVLGRYYERNNGQYRDTSIENLGKSSLTANDFFKDNESFGKNKSPISDTVRSFLPVSTVYASTQISRPPNRLQEILTFGVPSFDPLRPFENHVVLYDRRNRVPHWVFEHLKKEHVEKNDKVDRKSSDFTEDQAIHPFFRSTNADYKRSGYDRGHMAAASNHRHSQKAMDDTFCLSNIAPQVIKIHFFMHIYCVRNYVYIKAIKKRGGGQIYTQFLSWPLPLKYSFKLLC